MQIRATAFLGTLSNSLIEAVTAVEEAIVVLITHEAAARRQRPNLWQATIDVSASGHSTTTCADVELPRPHAHKLDTVSEGSEAASEQLSSASPQVWTLFCVSLVREETSLAAIQPFQIYFSVCMTSVLHESFA